MKIKKFPKGTIVTRIRQKVPRKMLGIVAGRMRLPGGKLSISAVEVKWYRVRRSGICGFHFDYAKTTNTSITHLRKVFK